MNRTAQCLKLAFEGHYLCYSLEFFMLSGRCSADMFMSHNTFAPGSYSLWAEFVIYVCNVAPAESDQLFIC